MRAALPEELFAVMGTSYFLFVSFVGIGTQGTFTETITIGIP